MERVMNHRASNPAEGWPRIGLVLGGGLFFLPVAYLVLLSFSDSWFAPHLFPSRITLRNWALLFGSQSDLLTSLAYSIVLSVVVAALSTGMGFLAGRYVSYHRRRIYWLRIVYLPFAVSPIVLGTLLMNLYLRLGIAGSFFGVILSQFTIIVSFSILFFDGFWTHTVRSLEEDAESLGCSNWQRFRLVTVPVAREAIQICFLQAFLISWYQYGITLLVGGGRVRTLPILVYDYIGEANPYVAAIASLLLTLPPLALLVMRRKSASI